MFVMDMLSCNDGSAHVDHHSVHNFVDGYEKVAFAVPCIDGIVYDAATGSCVSAVGGQETGTNDHTTKYTAQRYLTTVFDIHDDALECKIFAANTITDTGLDWQCIFHPAYSHPQVGRRKVFRLLVYRQWSAVLH